VDFALSWIHDLNLVHIVGRVERELLPRLVLRRDNLDYKSCCGKPGPSRSRAVQSTVGRTKVPLGGTIVRHQVYWRSDCRAVQ
jgi:hypothetical protein